VWWLKVLGQRPDHLQVQEERQDIVVDRSELLRMFSNLKDENEAPPPPVVTKGSKNLTCPSCGAVGSVRGEDAFEVRGRFPDGHLPVRKCNACGAGLVVTICIFPRSSRATAIPSDLWARMDAEWNAAFGE
jgi:hypothetical protein